MGTLGAVLSQSSDSCVKVVKGMRSTGIWAVAAAMLMAPPHTDTLPDGTRAMKWITREKVKVDPVACRWLIRKFIDPDAVFVFLPKETDWSSLADGTAADSNPANPHLAATATGGARSVSAREM